MNSPALATAMLGLVATLACGTATAQTIPHHSGHPSFNAPHMRKHGSGFHRPNRPTHHHYKGHPGYKPVGGEHY